MDVKQKRMAPLPKIELLGTPRAGVALATFFSLFPGPITVTKGYAQTYAGPQSVVEAVEPMLVPRSIPIQTTNGLSEYENSKTYQQSGNVNEPERITPRSNSPTFNPSPSDLLDEISRDKKAVDKLESNKKDMAKDTTKKAAKSYLPVQRPIGQISIDVRPKPKGSSNSVPDNLALQSAGDTSMVLAARADEMMVGPMTSASLNRCYEFGYQPLYFEEVNLERYGRTYGHIQPALSGLRFFATIPSLPYAMTVHNPNKTYTWGWPYEAGWGAPKVRELEPLQWKPGMVQAAAVTGLIFVVP